MASSSREKKTTTASQITTGTKFKLIGKGKWNRELECVSVSNEEKGFSTRVVVTLLDGKIKLHPKEEIQII